MDIISKNTEDTNKIAKDFLKQITESNGKLKEEATVCGLYGDLGAGKTTFMQYLAKHMGVKRKVNSPTFVIMKKYRLPKQASHKNFLASKTKPVLAGKNFHANPAFKYLFHIDAYRLKNEKELEHLGWDEITSKKEHLIFVEWPERIIKAIPKDHHQIHIAHLSSGKGGTKEGHRKFKIKK